MIEVVVVPGLDGAQAEVDNERVESFAAFRRRLAVF